MQPPSDLDLRIPVPSWIDDIVRDRGALSTPEACMTLAIDLSARNVERGGGPFGAVIVSGARVVAAGVNLVTSTGLSLAHAEIIAILRAQKALAELAGAGMPAPTRPLTLYTSAEPCCQCFGAFVWSGFDALVCGATREDVEAIGFDEGPKPENWRETLEVRGMTVLEGVGRARAGAVLENYAARGGPIYGLRSPLVNPGLVAPDSEDEA